MTSDTHPDLVQIVDNLRQSLSQRSMEEVYRAMKQYPPSVLRSFTEDDTDPNWIGVWYREFDDFLLHSSHRPALNRHSYYLFGCGLTQRMWFDVLGYTEEEQVAHLLCWGRHD